MFNLIFTVFIINHTECMLLVNKVLKFKCQITKELKTELPLFGHRATCLHPVQDIGNGAYRDGVEREERERVLVGVAVVGDVQEVLPVPTGQPRSQEGHGGVERPGGVLQGRSQFAQ